MKMDDLMINKIVRLMQVDEKFAEDVKKVVKSRSNIKKLAEFFENNKGKVTGVNCNKARIKIDDDLRSFCKERGWSIVGHDVFFDDSSPLQECDVFKELKNLYGDKERHLRILRNINERIRVLEKNNEQ